MVEQQKIVNKSIIRQLNRAQEKGQFFILEISAAEKLQTIKCYTPVLAK